MKQINYHSLFTLDTLDTSDVILLSTEVLYRLPIIDDEIKNNCNQVIKAYLDQRYPEAIELLKSIYQNLPQEYQVELGIVINQLAQGEVNRADSPTGNESRRFFETTLAKSAWSKMDPNQFRSIEKLAAHMMKHYPKYSHLPQSIETCDHAATLIGAIRDYVPDTNIKSEVINIFRRYRNSLSIQKDRGNKKADTTLSIHQGILKSTTPTPKDFYRNEVRANVVDLFEINRGIINGFSVSNQYTPFVNSVSGTTYDFATLLLHYIEENKADENLQQDIDNITLAFLLFTCKEGFHSFYEMLAVLTEDNMVNFLFKLNRITVGSSPFEPYLEEPFRESASYAQVIASRKLMHFSLQKVTLANADDASSSGLYFEVPRLTLFSAAKLEKANNKSFQLHTRLHLEITTNARTGDPQPFLGAVITKITQRGGSSPAEITLTESNGTTELFEFFKNHLPPFYLTQEDKTITLNDYFGPPKSPVSNRAEVAKIPLVNAFNFRDENNNLLHCNDIRFIQMLANLCEQEGTEFIFNVSLENFNLPTKSKLFSDEEIRIVTDETSVINAIRLANMAGEADSKLSLLISPSELQPIATMIETAIGNYKGWAVPPNGHAAPYLSIAQAFFDRDVAPLHIKQDAIQPITAQRI